ncbi:MAG: hypothetical protein HYX68_12230 [Planctomycetes bacterium]|nr:hypothetical protein [Planctomycetota bacterium]
MAITLQCPRCTHEQKIDDSKAGKDVPCKICHHLIKPGGAGAKTTSKPAPASEKKASPASVKAGAPSPSPAAAEGPARKSKPAPVDDDDADDAKPRKKTKNPDDKRTSTGIRKPAEESSGMAYILIGAGVFVGLAFLCGGGGLGAYFLLGSSKDEVRQIAQNQDQEPNKQAPDNNPPDNRPNNNPPFNPNPPFKPNPPFNPNPPPDRLDANNPKDADRVIAMLKGPAQDRGPALNWLRDANPDNNPRRAQVALILDGMVAEYVKNPPPLGNDGVINPFLKWATKDNVPTLVSLADSDRFTVWDNRYRQESMKLLGKFKDPRGVAPIVRRLGNAFDGGAAFDALMEMGPVAESAVLPLFNDASFPGGRRDSARKLVKAYNTQRGAILDQCIKDLDSADGGRRGGALQWIAQSEPDARRKAEVAKLLNRSIENEGSFRNRDLVTAIEKWGGPENVQKLIQILDANRLGSRETIRLLGKLRDPEGTKAIARQLGNFFNGNDARQALKDAGNLAEPAVVEAMLATQDGRARAAYVNYLGEIGTRMGSLKALQVVAFRHQNDRQLAQAIQNAVLAINARGK